MKVNLKYIVLCVLLLPLFCACSSDSGDIVAAGGDPVLVTFSLDVQSSSTRADDHTWGDNTDDNADNNYPEIIGNSLEDRIDLSSLLVMAYHSDFSFGAELPIIASNDNNGHVTFTCVLPKSMPYVANKECRIMVIANCTNKNYGLSYENNAPNLDDLMYSTPIQNTIPLWGLTTYTFPAQASAYRVFDLGTINMLRAAAKIGVKLSKELKQEGYSINEIKLNYANANGYSAPKDWHHADTKFTESLAHNQAFRPANSTLATGINTMARGTETDGYYIYVPETINGDQNYQPSAGDATSELSLAVTVKKGDDEYVFEYKDGIKFCQYNNGKPTDEKFNIVRNHFYDYTITDVNMGLKLNLNVADWEAEDVWVLDFSAPVHSKLLTTASDNAPAPTAAPTVSYNSLNDEGGAFVGYFKMESPAGVSWKPTLANASAGDYEVRVYADGETNPGTYEVPVMEPSIEASNGDFFKIVVVAKNPNRMDKVVKLGISYTASWNDDDNSLLVINKGDNGLYYPWNDNNPDDDKDDPDAHWISIKQVASGE